MTDQTHLFSEPGSKLLSEDRRALVPTSRNNVLEWLSSRLITPRPSFEKYYDDALAVVPQVVPVVLGPPGADLLQIEGGPYANFPVLVEVDADRVRWVAEDVGRLDVAPLDAAIVLHFSDADQLEEFDARTYDNIPPDGLQRQVTPDLFAGDGPTNRSRLADVLTRPDGEQPAVNYAVSDRLGGARLLGLMAARRDERTLRTLTDAAFTRGRRDGRDKTPPSWIRIDLTLATYSATKTASLDERIFRAAASVMLGVDRMDAWDALAVLEQVDETLLDDPRLKDDDRSRWTAAAGRMRAILRGDEAFEAFNLEDFRMEKALLLSLIRSTPADVLSWDAETRAQPLELALAAALIGCVHGRKTCPTDLRPPALDAALAYRELADLSGVVELAFTPDVAVVPSGGADELVLRVADEIVLTAPLPPKSPSEIFEMLDLARPEVVTALVELALRQGWNQAVRSTVLFEGPVRVASAPDGLTVSSTGCPSVQSAIEPKAFAAALVDDAGPEVRQVMVDLMDS